MAFTSGAPWITGTSAKAGTRSRYTVLLSFWARVRATVRPSSKPLRESAMSFDTALASFLAAWKRVKASCGGGG
jgi:hypothetical protein